MIQYHHQNSSEQHISQRLQRLPVLFLPLSLDDLPEQQRLTIAQIDAVLPQTQCGLCGHHDGCLPYAHGIVVKGEPSNLCVPGGQAVSDAIARICQTPALPATPSKWQTNPKTNRPTEVRAIIDESECIGCTKCIPACPVDAIIGTAKHMHSVITDLCTGCELCLAPCPVDCIDLVEIDRALTQEERTSEQTHLRLRYHRHLGRITKSVELGVKPVVSTIESAIVNVLNTQEQTAIDERAAKNAIAAAKLRTQIKKLSKQLAVRDDDTLREQLDNLNQQLKDLSA